jgi:hypothetical protein
MEWDWLCYLGIGVAFIALVGHGLWVLAARLLGFRVRTTRSTQYATFLTCPRCRKLSLSSEGRCFMCGWSNTVVPRGGSGGDDLARMTEQLDRFVQAGLIDGATHARVMIAIRSEQDRLRAGVATVPPPLPAAVVPLQVLPLEPDAPASGGAEAT